MLHPATAASPSGFSFFGGCLQKNLSTASRHAPSPRRGGFTGSRSSPRCAPVPGDALTPAGTWEGDAGAICGVMRVENRPDEVFCRKEEDQENPSVMGRPGTASFRASTCLQLSPRHLLRSEQQHLLFFFLKEEKKKNPGEKKKKRKPPPLSPGQAPSRGWVGGAAAKPSL